MTEALIAGKVITLPTVGLFADGAAVKTVGQETFRVSEFSSIFIAQSLV
jgi:threonine dehydratase